MNRNKDITTNKQPANERGGRDITTAGGVQSSKELMCTAACHRSSALHYGMMSMNKGLRFTTKPTLKSVSDTWSEIQRYPGPDKCRDCDAAHHGVFFFKFLDLPTLDILKYHISTGKDENMCQVNVKYYNHVSPKKSGCCVKHK